MLTFKVFVFAGIVSFLLGSIQKVRRSGTTKNKLCAAASIILFLFGVYMLADAFM